MLIELNAGELHVFPFCEQIFLTHFLAELTRLRCSV